MNNKQKSYLFIGITQLIWPTNAAATNLQLEKFSFIQLLMFNSFTATLLLFVISLCTGKIQLLHTCKKSDIPRLILMPIIGILGYLLALYRAYEIIDTQTAYILQRQWPVFVIIFSIVILNEKLRLTHAFGFLLCIIGTIILIGGFDLKLFSSDSDPIGIMLAFIAAVCYGLYSTLGKKYDQDRITTMLIYYFIAFVLLIPIVMIENKPIPEITLYDILGFFWVGGLVLGIGDLSWFLALKYGETNKMTSISFLSPVLALFWIYLLLDESIRYSSIVGMGIIMIGIYINQNNSPSEMTSPT